MSAGAAARGSEALFRALGAALGYPPCCVEDFVNRTMRREPCPERTFHGTGFVPCAECDAEARKDPDRFVAEKIAPSRSIVAPFPLFWSNS